MFQAFLFARGALTVYLLPPPTTLFLMYSTCMWNKPGTSPQLFSLPACVRTTLKCCFWYPWVNPIKAAPSPQHYCFLIDGWGLTLQWSHFYRHLYPMMCSVYFPSTPHFSPVSFLELHLHPVPWRTFFSPSPFFFSLSLSTLPPLLSLSLSESSFF